MLGSAATRVFLFRRMTDEDNNAATGGTRSEAGVWAGDEGGGRGDADERG